MDQIPRFRPQVNLKEALDRALDELKGRDPAELAAQSGGVAKGSVVEIACLGRKLAVDLDAGEVRFADASEKESDAAPGDSLGAIVARYLMQSGGLPDEPGPEIGFADWPDARNYAGPFKGRALGALIGVYGHNPQGFAEAAESLGGEKVDVDASGAVAYRLRVFPRAAVVVILHPADDELPADGQMVFARGLFEAFAPDDVVAFGELASKALRGKL